MPTSTVYVLVSHLSCPKWLVLSSGCFNSIQDFKWFQYNFNDHNTLTWIFRYLWQTCFIVRTNELLTWIHSVCDPVLFYFLHSNFFKKGRKRWETEWSGNRAWQTWQAFDVKSSRMKKIFFGCDKLKSYACTCNTIFHFPCPTNA